LLLFILSLLLFIYAKRKFWAAYGEELLRVPGFERSYYCWFWFCGPGTGAFSGGVYRFDLTFCTRECKNGIQLILAPFVYCRVKIIWALPTAIASNALQRMVRAKLAITKGNGFIRIFFW
jgi:hypothetical protein